MSGEERRGKIIQALKNSDKAVSATTLAKEFDVSRQVIVQDVALLRANGKNIFSTNRGYLIQEDEETTRVFKVQHEDDEVEKELTTIVDLGGTVEDVFVYHKVYGVLRAEMNIKSRMDIRNYMEEIRSREIQSAEKCYFRISLSYGPGGTCGNSGYDSGGIAEEGAPCKTTGL